MKTSFQQKVVALATVIISAISVGHGVQASTFDQAEVDQSKFIAVSAPYGNNSHQLLIIEQISSKQQCWSESGSNPVKVDPLLLNFDFTGICGRSTDSNGYSIRMAGTDLALKYTLTLETVNGDVLLMGTPVDYQGKS